MVTVPYHSETENRAESHPQLGFTDNEPFLAHCNPGCVASASAPTSHHTHCVTLTELTQPLRNLLRGPSWIASLWLASALSGTSYLSVVVFSASDQIIPCRSLPLTALQTHFEILGKPRPKIST